MLLLLDLSAALDSVDHDILLKRLDSRFSICGTALDWFRSYLTNRTQFALIEGKKSQPRELKCGVPQGSFNGPKLYLLYTAPLADVLRHHKMQFHFFADDTQLYISFSWNNDLELASTIAKIQDCLSDLDRWMSLNKLKLNKDKTELLYLHSKHCSITALPTFRFGSDTIHPSDSARNIGVIFNSTISMLPRVNSLCKSAFYHLPNISCIRKFLSLKSTEISPMLSYPPSLTTAILFCIMCRSIFWKSFNQYRMLPPASLLAPANTTTSLQFSSIYTGFL